MTNAVVVFTYKSKEEIILKEGTESWVLNPERARKSKYVICTRNSYDSRKIWKGKERHREAFLICKISKIIESPYYKNRYKINFDEYSEISIPEYWSKFHNPVNYKNIDLKDFKNLSFKKTEKFKEGQLFKNRKEIVKHGLHNNNVFGIAQEQGIAKAVVLSGGYIDETDDRGNELIYIGQGGRDKKTGRQNSNQSFEKTFNKALVFNCEWNIPVRVFRGSESNSIYAPKHGYRYDGKYLINDYWYSVGIDGFKVCNFKLVKPEKFISNVKTKYITNIKTEDKKKLSNNPISSRLVDIDLNKLHKKWEPKGGLNFDKLKKNYLQKLELNEKNTNNHQKVVKTLGKILKDKGLKHKEGEFDLYTEKNGSGKLFEVKTWKPENLKSQTRDGAIKLLEYKIRYKKEKKFLDKVDLFLLFDKNPIQELSKKQYLFDLLNSLSITICWINGTKVLTEKRNTSELNWLN